MQGIAFTRRPAERFCFHLGKPLVSRYLFTIPCWDCFLHHGLTMVTVTACPIQLSRFQIRSPLTQQPSPWTSPQSRPCIFKTLALELEPRFSSFTFLPPSLLLHARSRSCMDSRKCSFSQAREKWWQYGWIVTRRASGTRSRRCGKAKRAGTRFWSGSPVGRWSREANSTWNVPRIGGDSEQKAPDGDRSVSRSQAQQRKE